MAMTEAPAPEEQATPPPSATPPPALAIPPPSAPPQGPQQDDPIEEFIALPHEQQMNTLQQLPSDKQDLLLAEVSKRQSAKKTATPPQGSFIGDVGEGFKSALNQTGETAMKVVGNIGVGKYKLNQLPSWQQSQQQTHAIATEPMDTAGKMTGAFVENVLEFLSGDEALKGLSTAAKISELAKVEQAMSKSPVLTRMLGNAVRAQTVGTAQAAAHGATGGEAVASGATAALGGAALESLGAGGRRLLQNIRPTTESVLGETMPVLASQRPGASTLAEDVADIRSEPQTATAQQQAAQRGIKNRAQQVTASELDKLNAARRLRWQEGEGEMNLAPDAQATTAPTSPELPSGQAQLPAATATGAPQLEAGAAPTGVARTGEVGSYEGDFPQQPGETTQPTPAAQPSATPTQGGQRVKFMESTPPNFAPIDAQAESANIRSFGDAAEKIREHAAPVFDTFDKATNGEYTRLRDIRDQAYAENDYKSVRNAEQAIDGLFSDTRGKVDRLDYRTAKTAWRSSKILDAVHDAVSKSFNIADEDLAARSGEWRGINGGSLMRGVNRLTRDYGTTAVEDVIGKDGLTGLTKIAARTQTPQRAALYGQKVGEIADTMAGMPGISKTPALVNYGKRILLNRIATEPSFASKVNYIFDNKIPPSIYRGILGGFVNMERPDFTPYKPPGQEDREVVPADKARGVKPVTLPVLKKEP